jgi:hypothetical protein
MIAGPTKALVSKALQIKTTGTSIARSAKFLELEPRDQYANFSAVVYQNLGSTIGPLAGLLGSFVPPQAQKEGQNAIAALQNLKPMLVAAYAEGDRITVAAGGNVLAQGLSGLLNGNLSGMIGGPMQFGPRRQMRQMQQVR